MRRAAAFSVCLLVVSFATGCKKKPAIVTDPPASTVTPSLPTASATPEKPTPKPDKATTAWVTFEPEPTKFSLVFPGVPEQKATPTPSAAGTMIQHDAQVSYKDSFYAIGWMDFPAGATVDPKKALDGARDGAVKGAGGRIKTEKNVKLNGKHPGRDIVFEVIKPIQATGYLRMYMVGKRFYQTLVVEPAAHPDQTSVDKFLESFKVK
jgi:hypothetical protein